ncbi:alpha-L-arabinofuranosidase C-terminal domain-containing protein [Chitinophaga silvisoli]|uniref:non-reducing end alpha-L-arabinofuranosidase n=1 Tax=Chitinophaga silvisoli TaxID=2291814 RepID=A0A3E1NXJ3_9BACT|nr:alpha-L-arabinofuranosidase C-terminal domain-containing protein [Chitinophaga silvisoli]RFM32632.1 alpha-N-arabinofuranosidase [Chitinophaga silvisoli]
MQRSLFTIIIALYSTATFAQRQKAISPDLFGIFFEDISYSADGGLYAELIQNRSFEYTGSDHKGWHPMTAWEYTPRGYAYGKLSVETKSPLNENNTHYVVLDIQDVGQEGLGLTNYGFNGIPVKEGEQYDVSLFAALLAGNAIPVTVSIRNRKGDIYGETTFDVTNKNWQQYAAGITVNKSDDSACLVIIAKGTGKLAIDQVSLFPKKTFKDRTNGMRPDLSQAIADLHPKFMRFPGGCLVHGDGIANIYNWKNTIGPLEARVDQRNIWNYHQSAGLGYFEYFQFCEDIGAKPVPILAAGVSCQNSGGTWVIGSTGQKGIPMADMQAYIQDVLDLVEYANGPATSVWGAKRAAAGHPEPFHLQYLGIGNEDKMTPDFEARFTMIYNAVKAKHPEITVIGTAGPSSEGEDYEKGWAIVNKLKVPVVDEHYYNEPEWFLKNNQRYDKYDRKKAKVYIGEYASRGNKFINAISEATYMTSLERNGDVVHMASYAPLLAKKGNTNWNPDLIYFDNTGVYPTVNYYVQQLFSSNSGDVYISDVVTFDRKKDSTLAASVVKDSKTGDVIVKLVNAGATDAKVNVNLKALGALQPKAQVILLKEEGGVPVSVETEFTKSSLTLDALSMQVIRLHKK